MQCTVLPLDTFYVYTCIFFAIVNIILINILSKQLFCDVQDYNDLQITIYKSSTLKVNQIKYFQ